MSTIPPSARLGMRSKPSGMPIMQQNWENLLFLHWTVDPALLRPLIPAELELDTFEGKAWIGLTPFAVTNLRLASLPPVPTLHSFLELNVRTYVHFQGTPGVWFFSLDASKAIPAMAARLAYALPYHKATMSFEQGPLDYRFSSERAADAKAQLRAAWRVGAPYPEAGLDSLLFFLVERYCLFAHRQNDLMMTRVYHAPWALLQAELTSFSSSMISVAGIPEPTGPPLVHFSKGVSVELWPPGQPVAEAGNAPHKS